MVPAELLYIGTDPIWTALIRFFINLIVLFIVIRLIYYPFSRNEEDLFTFFLMGVMIFLICVLLKAVEVKIGIALGLFAVFGIIRFRTTNFSGKSMAYFFAVIGISVINALVTFPNPLRDTIIVNVVIILTVLLLEIYLRKITPVKHQMSYDKMMLLSPEKRTELINDITSRTGIKVKKVRILRIDLIKGRADLEIFYYDKNETPNVKLKF